MTDRSEWQTPLAVIWTTTSRAPGALGVDVLDDERLVVLHEDGCAHGNPCPFSG